MTIIAMTKEMGSLGTYIGMEVAKRLLRAVEQPNVKDLLRLEKERAETFEVVVGNRSDALGRTLGELKITDGTVVAIERKNEVIIPRGDTRIVEGDRVTVFAAADAVERLAALFSGKR